MKTEWKWFTSWKISSIREGLIIKRIWIIIGLIMKSLKFMSTKVVSLQQAPLEGFLLLKFINAQESLSLQWLNGYWTKTFFFIFIKWKDYLNKLLLRKMILRISANFNSDAFPIWFSFVLFVIVLCLVSN